MRHSFSILLIMCILMVIGAALIPYLDISNEPRPEQGKTLTISYSWRNASAKVVEQNVTSRIEAMVSSVRGVEKVSSVSRFGSGRITVELKKNVQVSPVKFEIASLLRQIRPKLPEQVSYPTVSGGEVDAAYGDDNEVKLILTYQLNADMSNEQMRQIAEREMKSEVERIEGVHHVEITGTASHYMEVEYDAEQLALYGIHSSDIADAIRNYAGREDVIGEVQTKDGKCFIPLVLSSKEELRRFEQMPLKNIGGKIIYLNNLASCNIRERMPDSYFRVNGMNTIYINVYAEKDANVIGVSDHVKEAMGEECYGLPNCKQTYDRAEEQIREFRTLVARSALTLAILLFFVWITGGRKWKYLAIIGVSLLANILIASAIYRLLDIRLHPMSMAGITVSLGIIIDSAIIMVDHYTYYRNRRAFVGIMAAMLTTVGSLVIVFWLPDYLRHDLKDFSIVVMVNLLVAILVAVLFVPALTSQLGFSKRRVLVKRNTQTRLILLFTKCYSAYVRLSQRIVPRIVLLLLFAGVFAGSLKLFVDCLDSNTFRPKDRELQLTIRAKMPVGGNVQELNEKVKEIEVFLSQFDEIKRFETSIRSRGARIVVEFKEDALKTGSPYMLESRVIGKVITIGGADWATSGVSERGFSNSLNLQYREHSIEIAGYDYERLYRFAEDMCREMKENNRVTDIAIVTPGHEEQEDELYMEYERRSLAIDSVSPNGIHGTLNDYLANRNAGKIEVGGKQMDVVVHPATVDAFDLWNLRNSYITVEGMPSRPSDFMDINWREAKNIIPRENQEYVLRVAFNVLGSYTYTSRYIKRITEKFNASFPIGFRCLNKTYGVYEDDGTQYWLIGLVAIIIFFILSITFESLMQALAITMLIPVSFIGLFLTYYLTGVPFGSGGFAAMVMLAGLTVNAGIYVICQYNNLSCSRVKTYVTSVNRKILPILLTILSTMLGMIPFLIDGHEAQPFWFSLAVGTIGGLMASIIPLVLFLPLALRIVRK